MRNIRLDLCYDGTRYKGWQRLTGVDNTLQGKLEQTLSRILQEPIEVSGSGRTDAGAHALGQVASFHCENKMPCPQLLEQLRRYLPEDIGKELELSIDSLLLYHFVLCYPPPKSPSCEGDL